MMALLEAATRVHANPDEQTASYAVATRAAVLDAMPQNSQDLATRLSLLMLDHALHCAVASGREMPIATSAARPPAGP